MSQEANIDLDFFESLESKSQQLFQQFVDHVSKVQEQMQQMSTSTTELGHVYLSSTQHLCEELEASTRKSIELITHCDELDKDLLQLQELARQMYKHNEYY
ncbi:hypothetical protein RMATCC62417_12052 [Rhizopus microsporus]|nr:hypothetical protein RMATCC62417_12052 [Rhizopus microsporus]